MPHQVIVNADDFGLSPCENAVILGAFQAGLISSATAMANMPAFDAACVMAQHPLLKGRIGLHFNLTYGRPLSQGILGRPTPRANSTSTCPATASGSIVWIAKR